MAKVTIRVRVPKNVKKGEVVQIRTLISHRMESGQRKDEKGRRIPRKILNKFVCEYNGEEVFVSDWHPALSANPYLAFYIRAEKSGTLEFSWTDDDGTVYRHTAPIQVD